MAALNTFGAVLAHAIGIEAALADYYAAAGDPAKAAAAAKRRQTMERVRREHVVEITLEPIDGLESDHYTLDTSDTSPGAQALAAATASRFYADAAPKMNVRSVQRAFERAAAEHGS